MSKPKYSVKLCRPIVNLDSRSKATFYRSYTEVNGCWEWNGLINNKGYALMNFIEENGTSVRNMLASRVAYFLHHGCCPQHLHVMHSCDNPKCVNHEHLSLGTHKENMNDRDRKGRNKVHYGENNFQCCLTPEKVLEIRELSKQGLSSIKIGARFGVSKTSILMILNGRTWGHVQSP